MSSNIASFFSSFMSTAHADAEEKASTEEASVQEEEEEEPEPEDARLFNVGHKGLLYLSPPFFFVASCNLLFGKNASNHPSALH